MTNKEKIKNIVVLKSVTFSSLSTLEWTLRVRATPAQSSDVREIALTDRCPRTSMSRARSIALIAEPCRETAIGCLWSASSLRCILTQSFSSASSLWDEGSVADAELLDDDLDI